MKENTQKVRNSIGLFGQLWMQLLGAGRLAGQIIAIANSIDLADEICKTKIRETKSKPNRSRLPFDTVIQSVDKRN